MGDGSPMKMEMESRGDRDSMENKKTLVPTPSLAVRGAEKKNKKKNKNKKIKITIKIIF